MSITNKILDIALQQPVATWRVISTEGELTPGLPIAVGQQVFCDDGYPGKITHLLPNRAGWVGAFAVRTRGWSRRQVIVPIDFIDHIDGESVYLSIGKNELKQLPTFRPDTVLAALVNQALWEDTILRRTEYQQIDVEVEHGIAYLSGYVSSSSMSHGAEKAALKVDGVWKVENDLTIDSELRIAVARAIAEDARTRDTRVFVGVNNGFVTLTGKSQDLAGRSAAREQAASIPKVRGVINSIQVPGVNLASEDQRALQPVIGAGVYATDMPIGKVEKVVINPDNRLVTAILVNAVLPDVGQIDSNWLWSEHHYSERRVIVPIETVRHLTSTSVFLKERGVAVSGFDDFDRASYALAPEYWEPPYPYKQTDILTKTA